MWITRLWLVLLSVGVILVHIVTGDTILYTNSPRHLVTSENYTSYKLAVPGANPITIIEATQGPPKDDDDPASAPGSLNDMRRQNWIRDEEFLFRRKNFNEGHLGKEDADQVEQTRPRTTVYSPDLLKKFLADYAAKVKPTTPEKKEKLQEILLFDDDDEEMNFPTNSQPEEKYNKHHHHHHDWNQKNKYDDRRYDERPNSGWVTMDVIPWSSSKVSKWQGHIQRLPNRPQNDPHRPDFVSMEDLNDDRYHYNRPNRPNHNNDFDDVDRFSSSASHYQNQNHHHHHHSNKFPDKKPYYEYQSSASSSNNHYNAPPDHNKDIYRPWGADIITDNRAPDFPDHQQSMFPTRNRRPGGNPYDYNEGEYRPYESNKPSRPTANPESGNGDWILVSTTKGYHRPRNGQRAVAVKPQSFTSHKTVKLSVTAEKPQHSTFSFDSEPQHPQYQYHEDQSGEHSMPSPTATKAPAKKTPIVQKQQKKVVKKVMNVNAQGVDSSAVLAAVGAGMVPATVAMLMPMIAGRRKKRDVSATLGRPRNVTHFPDLDYEETLPRILQQHVR